MLFFHAMGVTGESSEPVAKYLQDRYFCILPTSTVYCEGQKYISKADEIRQVEKFLKEQGVKSLTMMVASSIGADLAVAFLTQTKLPVGHAFFDGGQFAQIGKGTRRIMTRFCTLPSKVCIGQRAKPLKKSCGATTIPSSPTSLPRVRHYDTGICAASYRTVWKTSRFHH